MRLLSLFLNAAFAQGVPPSNAQVLVPEFTPATVSDIVVSELLYQSYLAEMKSAGLRVFTAEQIQQQTPDLASYCADTPGCPGQLLTYYRAPLVMVVRVARSGENLEVRSQYYGVGSARPIAETTELVAPGQEAAAARRAAGRAREVLALVGDVAPPVEEVDPRITAPPVDPPEVKPDPPEVKPDPPEVKPDPPEVKPDPPEVKPDPPPIANQNPTLRILDEENKRAQRRQLGVNEALYKDFVRDTGGDEDAIDDWKKARRIRTNLVSLELQGGGGGGGIAEVYEVIYGVEHDGLSYSFDESSANNRATQQVLVDPGGMAPVGIAGFGVHVHSKVEIQLVGGVWRSQQLLYRGWVVDSDVYGQVGPEWESVDESGEPTAEVSGGPAVAVLLEPRVRLYARGQGVAKPYALAGASFMVLGGYQIGDKQMVGEDGTTSAWSYDDPGGLNVPGVVGGAGLMIDPSVRVGLFIEGAYTWNIPVATRSVYAPEGPLADAQRSYDQAGSNIRAVGGVQLRF